MKYLVITKRDYLHYDLNTSLSQWNHISKVDGTRADIQLGLDKTFLAPKD